MSSSQLQLCLAHFIVMSNADLMRNQDTLQDIALMIQQRFLHQDPSLRSKILTQPRPQEKTAAERCGSRLESPIILRSATRTLSFTYTQHTHTHPYTLQTLFSSIMDKENPLQIYAVKKHNFSQDALWQVESPGKPSLHPCCATFWVGPCPQIVQVDCRKGESSSSKPPFHI